MNYVKIVLSVGFLALAIYGSFLAGATTHQLFDTRPNAIANGCAAYDPHTGKWGWVNTESAKHPVPTLSEADLGGFTSKDYNAASDKKTSAKNGGKK